MPPMKELPIPTAATHSSSARELLRVWAAQGAQHVSIATGLWADPGAWGIVLADLARHVSRAYEQSGGPDSAAALSRIQKAMAAEFGHATDEPKGNLIG